MVYKGMQSSLSTFGSYGVYLIYLKLALLVKERQKRANASGVYRDKYGPTRNADLPLDDPVCGRPSGPP